VCAPIQTRCFCDNICLDSYKQRHAVIYKPLHSVGSVCTQNQNKNYISVFIQTIVQTKCYTGFPYLSINDGRQTKIIKNLGTIPPDRDASILSKAFVIKPVYLSDLSGFMITTYKCNTIWIPHL
jgi:hypothetical protein